MKQHERTYPARRSWVGLGACAIAVVALTGIAGPARAEPAAPQNAFELSLGLGYSQGFGWMAGGGPRLQDFGKAGLAAQLDAGWRIDPRWLVGVYGEFGVFDGGDMGSDHANTLAAGVQGQFHFRPEEQLDPWVGLGFGWRRAWASFGDATYDLYGLDLVRVRAGLDYRLGPKVAVGPVIGFTLTEFLRTRPPAPADYTDVEEKRISTYLFVGLAGRFDS